MLTSILFAAFGAYVAAAAIYLARFRAAGIAVFAVGSAFNVTASLMRAAATGHLPFSNMYETMITLGACMFPFLVFTEWVLKSRTGWIDALLGAVFLFPSAFQVSKTFTPAIRPLPPALQSDLFFPHVMTYLLAYAALGKGVILSVLSLARRARGGWEPLERTAYRVTALGFPLLTAGLLLGAVWAKEAWGDWWSWDPKEVWSLITWILYLIYFHLRVGKARPKAWVEVMNLLGFLAVITTLLAVNLSGIFGGLHAYS